MTTLSSLNVAPPLVTPSSNTVDTLASTSSVVSQAAAAPASESTIVTIPSLGVESLNVYTPQGTLDGAAPALNWAHSGTDAVSLAMAGDVMANSVSGQFSNLGSALLDRFMTTGSDFSQSVTVNSTSAGSANGQSARGAQGTSAGGAITLSPTLQTWQGDVNLTVKTTSGATVNIEIDSANGKLAVSVKSNGQLTDVERKALANLADGFQQAIDGLGAVPPTLDLSGLMQFNSSVLSSVNLQFNVTGDPLNNVSANFSADSSARSLSITDPGGTMNVKVDTGNSALLGSGAQRDQAIASYLQQFDSANAKGHGDAAMMAMFKDAFTQLNSDEGTSSQQPAGTVYTPPAWMAQSEQAMLTGLDDFTASITDAGSPAKSFSYQVSQNTKIEGDLRDGTISQQQQSHLKASFREELAGSSQNYDDVQIDDSASSTVNMAMEQGNFVQATLTQSSSDSTRVLEYAGGKLVSDVTTPSNTSDSKDLLALLKPMLDDGEAQQDSPAWQQTLSNIHGMILLNANAN